MFDATSKDRVQNSASFHKLVWGGKQTVEQIFAVSGANVAQFPVGKGGLKHASCDGTQLIKSALAAVASLTQGNDYGLLKIHTAFGFVYGLLTHHNYISAAVEQFNSTQLT